MASAHRAAVRCASPRARGRPHRPHSRDTRSEGPPPAGASLPAVAVGVRPGSAGPPRPAAAPGDVWPPPATSRDPRRSPGARGARRRGAHPSARPPHDRLRPPRQGSRARSARNRRSHAQTRSREPSSRRSRSPRPRPSPPRRTAQAPRRTGRPTRSRGAGGTARSSCDRAPGWRRSRAMPHPRRSAARSAATTAHRPRSSRATAPPSSPDHAPPAHPRRRDRRHKTRPDRPAPRRQSQTTRGDPQAATHAGSAATTTPARDHTPGSSAACRHRLITPDRPPLSQQPPWKGREREGPRVTRRKKTSCRG